MENSYDEVSGGIFPACYLGGLKCRAQLASGRTRHCFTGALTPYPFPSAARSAVPGHYADSLRRRIYRLLAVRCATPWRLIHPRGYPLPRSSRDAFKELNAIIAHLVKCCATLDESKPVSKR